MRVFSFCTIAQIRHSMPHTTARHFFSAQTNVKTDNLCGGILMRIIVSKFGGSSVADARCFRRVRQIVEACARRRFIILSAPGRREPSDDKITDLLLRAHNESARGGDPSNALQSVRARFEAIAGELNVPICPDEFFEGLDRSVRVSADYAASRGEFLCAKLFAAYANLPFVDASSLIHFDACGRLLQSETENAIRAMARRMVSAVIPGFYGSLPDGSVHAFPRGGSDVTGALVASSLEADAYENWTDVDGLMSADPALCPDAVCHPLANYRQMRVIALSGARVLHPMCLEPVRTRGVPTILRNTFSPDKPGTYISDAVRSDVACVCALSGFRAVDTSDLSAETLGILDGIARARFFTRDHRETLALRGCGERPSTVVSALGFSEKARRAALEALKAFPVCEGENCMRALVPEGEKNAIVRRLHALL